MTKFYTAKYLSFMFLSSQDHRLQIDAQLYGTPFYEVYYFVEVNVI